MHLLLPLLVTDNSLIYIVGIYYHRVFRPIYQSNKESQEVALGQWTAGVDQATPSIGKQSNMGACPHSAPIPNVCEEANSQVLIHKLNN